MISLELLLKHVNGMITITLSGYGVLHPTSWYSKVICCLYAMFGLPLYIIMLGAAG